MKKRVKPTMTRETREYLAFSQRIIRAHGRRVADGDPEDLRDMATLRATLRESLALGVKGLRAQGVSWARIGKAVNMTRQAAQAKWGRSEQQ